MRDGVVAWLEHGVADNLHGDADALGPPIALTKLKIVAIEGLQNRLALTHSIARFGAAACAFQARWLTMRPLQDGLRAAIICGLVWSGFRS